MVWKCLGYRFDNANNVWTSDKVFPNWLKKYPTPPDFINMQRIYSKEIDQPCLRAKQALVKSITMEYKQTSQIKKFLKPLGWTGYQYSELTPNKTRRAQCANWLLYYRQALLGYTLEELQERKRLQQLKQQQQQEEEAKQQDSPKEWKPPVREVY